MVLSLSSRGADRDLRYKSAGSLAQKCLQESATFQPWVVISAQWQVQVAERRETCARQALTAGFSHGPAFQVVCTCRWWWGHWDVWGNGNATATQWLCPQSGEEGAPFW